MTFLPRFEYLPLALLLSALTLAGCSTTPEAPAPSAEMQILTNSEAVASIPERPLTAEQLEMLLEAELSAYRQDGRRAAQLYVQAADETRDMGVIQRGFELAAAFGEDEYALELAQIWREVQPGILPDRLAAQLFARVGETEAAWELGYPLDDEGLTLRIVTIETLSLGDPERMIWLEDQLASIEQPSFETWIARTLLRDALGDLENAVLLARQAYLERPQDIIAAEAYASLLGRLERDDDLELMISSWLLAYWTGDDSQTRVARMVTQLPLDRALPILRNVIAQKSNTQELELLLGQAYLNIPDVEAAEAIFQRLGRQPAYADISTFRLAQAEEIRNQPDRALELYSEVRPSGWFGSANQRAGQILLNSNGLNRFNEFFAAQRSRHPQTAQELYVLQASLLNDIGAAGALHELTSSALQLMPNQLDLLYLRSMASDQLGRQADAEADLRVLVQLDPENAQFLNALGYHLTDGSDQHEEAYGLIRQALILDPENAAIIDSMGWVLYNLEEYEQALIYLQEALNRFYNDEILVHMAATLIKLGRPQEAYELIEEGLGNLPNSQMLRDAAEQLEFGDIES